MKLLILTFFLLQSVFAFSQYENYLDGYVILEKGDTLRGKLKILSKEESCSQIKFINSNGEKVKLKRKLVNAYRRGGEYYEKKRAKPGALRHVYMLRLINGPAKLYRLNYTTKEDPSDVMSETYYSTKYYVEKKGDWILVPELLFFRKKMSQFFADNAEISRQINDGYFSYENLRSLVIAYNKAKRD